jgi:uncharacterized protein (UPF0216 family)
VDGERPHNLWFYMSQRSDLHQAFRTPLIIRINFIANDPVTIKDINMVEKIFGLEIGIFNRKKAR